MIGIGTPSSQRRIPRPMRGPPTQQTNAQQTGSRKIRSARFPLFHRKANDKNQTGQRDLIAPCGKHSDRGRRHRRRCEPAECFQPRAKREL
jgi:hypothetical protein